MMVLREWAGSFLAAGMACALLATLSPGGGVRRAFGVLTALLMLCSLLSPIQTLVHTLADGFVVSPTETPVSQALSDTAASQAISVIEEALYRDATERLADTDMTLKRVRVRRDRTQEQRIYINKAELVFDKQDAPIDPMTVQKLSMAWGIPTEVYYG